MEKYIVHRLKIDPLNDDEYNDIIVNDITVHPHTYSCSVSDDNYAKESMFLYSNRTPNLNSKTLDWRSARLDPRDYILLLLLLDRYQLLCLKKNPLKYNKSMLRKFNSHSHRACKKYHYTVRLCLFSCLDFVDSLNFKLELLGTLYMPAESSLS